MANNVRRRAVVVTCCPGTKWRVRWSRSNLNWVINNPCVQKWKRRKQGGREGVGNNGKATWGTGAEIIVSAAGQHGGSGSSRRRYGTGGWFGSGNRSPGVTVSAGNGVVGKHVWQPNGPYNR